MDECYLSNKHNKYYSGDWKMAKRAFKHLLGFCGKAEFPWAGKHMWKDALCSHLSPLDRRLKYKKVSVSQPYQRLLKAFQIDFLLWALLAFAFLSRTQQSKDKLQQCLIFLTARRPTQTVHISGKGISKGSAITIQAMKHPPQGGKGETEWQQMTYSHSQLLNNAWKVLEHEQPTVEWSCANGEEGEIETEHFVLIKSSKNHAKCRLWKDRFNLTSNMSVISAECLRASEGKRL